MLAGSVKVAPDKKFKRLSDTQTPLSASKLKQKESLLNQSSNSLNNSLIVQKQQSIGAMKKSHLGQTSVQTMRQHTIKLVTIPLSKDKEGTVYKSSN